MKMFQIIVYILCYMILMVDSSGLLLLYRPKDISTDCAFSSHLRYDLSFGMGMSDTLTVVFRTLNEIDYECVVEIVAGHNVYIIVVIKFPTNIAVNCMENRDAFTVIKKNRCLLLCEFLGNRDISSPYYVITVKERIRFRFLSNSSINSDMNADMYQVTATSARQKPSKECNNKNETICVIAQQEYCFTTGVVCDGIKNCGVTDWFDERKSECGLPVEYLTYAPVIAVVAAVACALLAAGHVMMRCLPPLAKSFFIFNANEDNRLCIDPIFTSPGQIPCDIEKVKRTSLIPIFSSSSSSINESEDMEQIEAIGQDLRFLSISGKSDTRTVKMPVPAKKRKTTMKSMSEKIQEKFRSVTGRGKSVPGTSAELMDA